MSRKTPAGDEITWLDRPKPGGEGEWLAHWLNEPSTPERERIGLLLQLVDSVLAEADRPGSPDPRGGIKLLRANEILGMYISRPQIFVKNGKHLIIGYEPVIETLDYQEWLAADCLMRLAARDLLNRVRKCPYCSGWLYARVEHKVYCSAKHQQEHFRATPEFKAKRRRYALTYYHENLSPKSARKECPKGKSSGTPNLLTKGRIENDD
jgi:hypothetical protein